MKNIVAVKIKGKTYLYGFKHINDAKGFLSDVRKRGGEAILGKK